MFPTLLARAINKLWINIQSSLQNGFRKCGIFPLNLQEDDSKESEEDTNESENDANESEDDVNENENVPVHTSIPRRGTKCVRQIDSSSESDSSSHVSLADSDDDVEQFSSLEEDEEEGDEEFGISGDYINGDFVIVEYKGQQYPGQILKCNKDGAFVRCMQRKCRTWCWPAKKDELQYTWSQVLKEINPPVQISKQNQYKVAELNVFVE